MSRARIVVAVVIVVPGLTVLIALVTGAVAGQSHWPGWLDYLREHAWLSLPALTLASGVAALVVTLPPRPDVDLDVAVRQLAASVRREYEQEAKWRSIFDPYPLKVTWTAAPADLVVPWQNVTELARSRPGGPVNRAHWATEPAELAGGPEGLAAVLRRVPTGRLLVLGDKGAGKTILLLRLILDLLPAPLDDESSPPPTGQVPMLIPLASWNPAEQDLQTWMVNWLITDRAGMAGIAQAGKRVTLARALLDAGKILPLLDGLDEIPRRSRARAIERINAWMAPDKRLVLTSRTTDYEEAVRAGSGSTVMLTGAAGVEVRPLGPDAVTSYLAAAAATTGSSELWAPVSAALGSADPPPVAQALTTPLMAALARVAYSKARPADAGAARPRPAELLDAERFPDVRSIEDYLFDRFIPASYEAIGEGNDIPAPAWAIAKAERWLVFLAEAQERVLGGTTDIAWWRLPTAVPPRLVGVILGVIAAVGFAVGYPFVGFGVGLLFGVAAGLASRRWFTEGRQGLGAGIMGGVIGGIAGAAMGLAALGSYSPYLLGRLMSGALAVGISMAVMNRLVPALIAAWVGQFVIAVYENAPAFASARAAVGSFSHLINAAAAFVLAMLFIEIVRRDSPAHENRWSRTWFATGLGCALVLGIIAAIQVGTTAGVAVGLAATAASAVVARVGESVSTDLAGAASPASVLRRDRKAFLMSWLGLGGAIGLVLGLAQSLTQGPDGRPLGPAHGVQLGVTTMIVVGLVFGFVQAMWGKYIAARCYLAACGRLPWRLTAFLQDAHTRRGVLRQVGAVYQFRHVEVQRRLASSRSQADLVHEAAKQARVG